MALTRREFGVLFGVAAASGIIRSVPGASAATKATAPARKAASPEEIWADLVQGNRRFVSGTSRTRTEPAVRRELAQGQHPKAIVLGCADSRVSPELVFDKNLGDLFVVRTAGNIADPIALGSIEYAVEHLHPSLLVVLGHEKCGAVTAAVSGEPAPTPGLSAIVAKITPAIDPLRGGIPDAELMAVGVQANVHLSAKDLFDSSAIVRTHVEDRSLMIVKALYRLASGQVIRLK